MLDFRFPGPETAEFEAAYQAALMGQLVAKQTREADTQGSVAALITSYMRHADYIGLREIYQDWLWFADRNAAHEAWSPFRSAAGHRGHCRGVRRELTPLSGQTTGLRWSADHFAAFLRLFKRAHLPARLYCLPAGLAVSVDECQ